MLRSQIERETTSVMRTCCVHEKSGRKYHLVETHEITLRRFDRFFMTPERNKVDSGKDGPQSSCRTARKILVRFRVPVFMKYLADVLGYDFDLEKENELKVLRSLTERLLHTDLQDRCVSFFVEECKEKDKQWRDAIEDVASHCSACDFGVERRFCRSESSWRCRLRNSKENIPFSRAAKILRGFTETNRMIPSELTESLLGAVRAIHEEVAEVCEGAMLTAEDVLPIMVFITVQAKLSTPHLALRYCEAYVVFSTLKISEFEYYETTLSLYFSIEYRHSKVLRG